MEMMNEEQAMAAAREALSGGEALGADDVTVRYGDGHEGIGWYAWHTEYPEEGSVLVGAAEAIASEEQYEDALAEVDRLILRNPAAGSDEAARLSALGALVEAYELRQPSPAPTTEEG